MPTSMSSSAKTLQIEFELEDCLQFARISGDFNPMHVNPLEARRTVFGKPVVHGMHLVMQGLEWLCSPKNPNRPPERSRLIRLGGSFMRPALVGDSIVFSAISRGAGEFRITVSSDKQLAFFDVTLRADVGDRQHWDGSDQVEIPLRTVSFENLRDATGTISSAVHTQALAARFPLACRNFPHDQLSDLVTTSTLVGMECPGRHSLYSRFAFCFDSFEPEIEDRPMRYHVARADNRFRMVTMKVDGPTISGEIGAFVRREPTRQLSFHEAVHLVVPGEFAGSAALVVGGSRGLGEATCKLLAAGGADVTLTYARGKQDALRVQEELAESPGCISVRHLDIHDPQLADLNDLATELRVFYFATPAISPGSNDFSSAKFHEFCDYYVMGVHRLVHGLVRDGHQVRGLLCPSTTFLDVIPRGMAEYVAAKAASEAICGDLETRIQGLTVHCPRWPKMETDQTAALVPAQFAETAQTVLTSVRVLYQTQ